MRLLAYLGRRAAFVIPQIFGVLLVTFIMVRLIPGDPAKLMGGALVSEQGLELIREKMGLSGSLFFQFIKYIKNVLQGDLGSSWYTGNTVMEDILTRLPATMELIILSLIVTFFIMIPIGLKAISLGKGFFKKISRKLVFGYGMAAGAFPDFWLGLILIFIFFSVLGWAPAPVGQLDIMISAPQRITGMILFDSLFTGNWAALKSSASHLILPVFVLAFVYGGGILKIAIVSASMIQKSEYINFAKVCSLPLKVIERYVYRATYPSIATISAVFFAFLIGGAVLVEQVFSWGGFGQYAVQSVVNSDFAAIQGVVIVSSILNLLVYIIVDLIYFFADPRIKKIG